MSLKRTPFDHVAELLGVSPTGLLPAPPRPEEFEFSLRQWRASVALALNVQRQGKRISQRALCSVGDWIAAKDVPAWQELEPERSFRSLAEDIPGPRFAFVPVVREIEGVKQLAWLRVE